ncbi:MAG: fimbria/pilus outer membrane usher protein, partial [Thermodesulfovibrionia bacterium]|nr:fimbria/pilus outer membrane usher protein [Thermodesulfovibrionia bacterium]
MWGKVSANNNAAYFTGHKDFIYKGITAFFFLALTIVIGIQPSYGNEKIIVSLALNGEARGESFAFMTEDGDFLLKAESLIDMGIPNPSGISSEIEGDTYLSLRSIKGLEFSFNENEVSLSIVIDPQLLPKNNIDMMTKKRIRSLSPEGSSLFLNYGLTYFTEDSQNINDLTISNQFGARVKKVLFQADSLYTKSDSNGGFTRLGTSFTYDRIDKMQRIVLGDFVASSGQLGGSVNMGGINVSKVYLINPYHIKHPKFNISGIAKFPSDVDIYLDGVKIKSLRVPPGPFEIKNIHRYAGQGEVKIVMRDPFGKEEEY